MKNKLLLEFINLLKDKHNMFLSVKNIYDCFYLAYKGIKNNKQYKDIFCEIFDFSEENLNKNIELNKQLSLLLNNEDICIKNANSIWVQKEYEVSKDLNDNEVKITDYEDKKTACDQINNWVSEQTNNCINQLVKESDINKDTLVALASAIYFCGKWHIFNSENTYNDIFYNFDNTISNCKLMFRDNFNGKVAENLYLDCVKIPYKNNDFELIVVLPKNLNIYNNILDYLDYALNDENYIFSKNVDLHLPIWKSEFTYDLKEIFNNSKFSFMFKEGNYLDNLLLNQELTIQHALHKSFIDISEEGTKAAAATIMICIECCSKPIRNKVIKINRPFYYFITYKSNNVLFSGKMSKYE